MKRKRTISMLLALVLLFTVALSGCSKDEKPAATKPGETTTESSTTTTESSTTTTEESVKQDPITFTVFIGGSNQPPTKDNKIYKMIEEKLNVSFEFEFLVGDLEQKLGVMIASGDYPDIINGSNSTNRVIESGALQPLNDFLSEEKTPNLMKHYDGLFNKITHTDGNIYVLPQEGVFPNGTLETSYNWAAFWLQSAVVKELGYPEIKTLDQYFDAIETYKAKYPEIDGQPTVGFEVLSYDWRGFCLKNAPAHLLGNPNDGAVAVDPTTNVASLYANTDGSKPYYQKLNEMYHKGIIEADTFVQNYDEYLAKLASGRVLGMYDQAWQFRQATATLIDQGKYERTYVPFAITYDESITPYYRDRPPLNINRGFGISIDNKNAERFVQLMEVLITDEWQKIFTWGIEGEDYMVDENGMFYRTEEQRLNAANVNWKLANKAETLFANLPKIQGLYEDGNAVWPEAQPSEFLVGISEIEKEVLIGYGINYMPEMMGEAPENRKYYPAWNIPLGDGTSGAVAEKKISELQSQYLPQLILGSTADFDSGWSNYLAQYDNIDVAAYLEIINQAIQDRLNQ